MRRLPEYFVKGLLFFLPLVVTLFVFVQIFSTIDGFLGSFFGLKVPGLGFVIGLLVITFIGYLTTNVFTKGIFNFVDLIFRNAPFVKLLYNSIRDLIDAFVGKKKMFDRPVMVTMMPGSEAKALGFITRDDLHQFNMQDHVVVYFPQSYNFAGQTLILPKENVTPVHNVASAEFMTFIVSAGIAGRKEVEKK